MTIRDLIDKHQEDGADHLIVAARVLADLGAMTKADILALVEPLVQDEARRLIRHGVREAEAGAPVPSGPTADPTKERRDVLASSFWVSPERSYVLWGEATVEDHLTRAAYLRTMAQGLCVTAERHERAARLLRARGASCLYELGDAFDAKEIAA